MSLANTDKAIQKVNLFLYVFPGQTSFLEHWIFDTSQYLTYKNQQQINVAKYK
jgi:hypothetical protein